MTSIDFFGAASLDDVSLQSHSSSVSISVPLLLSIFPGAAPSVAAGLTGMAQAQTGTGRQGLSWR